MRSKVIYRPHDRSTAGFFEPVTHLIRQSVQWRWLIRTNFIRDVKAPFAKAGFGPVWSIILPITPIGAYTFLFIALRPSDPGELHPAVFVTFGVTFWYLAADLVTSVIDTIDKRAGSVAKTGFPLIGVVISDLGRTCLDFLIRLAACVIVLVTLHGWPEPLAILSIAAILLALPMFIGLGLILGVFNAMNRDVGLVVTVVSRYGLFISGAIFPLAAVAPPEIARWLIALNPFAFFIETTRFLFVGEPLSIPELFLPAFGVYVVLAGILLHLGARIFYVCEYEIRGGAT